MNQHIIRGRRLVETRTPIGLPARPGWMFHPGRPCKDNPLWTSDEKADRNDAAELCRTRGCPVLQQCGRWAVENGEKHHVWGGLNFDTAEMHAVVAQVAAERPAPPAPEPVKPTAERVRELWEQGLSDSAIALRLGKSPGAVNHIRTRLGLEALYGPGGRPKQGVAA